MAADRQYSDAVLDSMQLAYGEGFLSPGGAQETRDLVAGLTVENKLCLDFGSGVGGASMLLADELGARHVTGVDVEPAAVERASRSASATGLATKTNFQVIEPEVELPFEAETFDIVITKDVICHVSDKVALFKCIHRVLRPGATFNIADWLLGRSAEGRPVFDDWLAKLNAYGLVFHYQTVDNYVTALEQAGFIDIQTTDHSSWSAETAKTQLDRALGEAKAVTASALGESGYEQRTALTRARLASLESGGVEHWLMRAVKPA
ncbi:MAG: hypothetical protein CMO26_09240 [Thiotrichales bacterium]|nr:hypothetical protein [Thiotrichales bacterium]